MILKERWPHPRANTECPHTRHARLGVSQHNVGVIIAPEGTIKAIQEDISVIIADHQTRESRLGNRLARKARSSRRPNSRPAPEGTPQPNNPMKGIIVCIRGDPRPNSEWFDRRMSPKIVNCLLESRLRQSQLLPARNTLGRSERGSRRAKKKGWLDRIPKHI